jgi:hypothetical protein
MSEQSNHTGIILCDISRPAEQPIYMRSNKIDLLFPLGFVPKVIIIIMTVVENSPSFLPTSNTNTTKDDSEATSCLFETSSR